MDFGSQGWYALRWRIEDFHRVLKTGCRVESRQVRAAEKLTAFIALDLVVAVHLLSMVWQARISPTQSIMKRTSRPAVTP